MFNLEKEITEWKKSLRKNPAFEDGDIAELESHLREEIKQLKNEGLSEEEAFDRASEEIGKPEPIGDELNKSRATQKAGPTPPWEQKSWLLPLLPNYLKIALRNLQKQKLYSAINIAGLSLALAVSLFGILFVTQELSYDTFHEDHERIYRVVTSFGEGSRQQNSLSEVPSILKTTVADQVPEIEAMVRIATFEAPVKRETDSFKERIFFAEEEYLDIFSFGLIRGDKSTALDQPNSVVISESMASKYFGNDNPLGQYISVYLLADYHDFRITGIIEDAPKNSSIQHDFLFSYQWLVNRNPDEYINGWSPGVFNFVKLGDLSGSVEEVHSKFSTVVGNARKAFMEERGFTPNSVTFEFQSISDMHLETDVQNWPNTVLLGPPPSNILYSYILISIAFVVLLIACINYTTYSIGYSVRRGKEVGVRKTLGAGRKHIMLQFWTETMILAFISLCLGFVLLQVLLPALDNVLNIHLTLKLLATPWHLLILSGLWLTVSFLAGSYPSLLLSGFKPQRVLKGETKSDSGKTLSKVLLGVQYAGVVVLIISLITIGKQLNYMQSRSFGNEEEQVLLIKNQRNENVSYISSYNRIKSSLQSRGHTQITASFGAVNDDLYMNVYHKPTGDEAVHARAFFTDYNYLEIYDEITLKEGRFFDEAYQGDEMGAIVVNETFAREMGLPDPIGTFIDTGNIPVHGDRVEIIGVVEDFHFESLHQPIAPAVFVPVKESTAARYISVRFPASETAEVLQDARSVWENIHPDLPFDYSFLDQRYEMFYASEQRWKKITSYATVFGILISVMGIIALTGLTANNRRKEIGIRKIMGASIPGIMVLLGRQFLISLGCAILIAVPVAHFILSSWLQNFSYAIDIGVIPYLLAAGITLTITILAFSYQALNTAMENPAYSLRSE